jgi:sugar phosphate isomerase/epimerase
MLLGAQSYTVRAFTQTERDFRIAMQRIAAIGYTSVQLSAIGPIDPQAIKNICEENGLAIVLTHTNPERILTDVDAVIREHELLGCEYIGIGSMPERYRNEDWIDQFAKDFAAPARKIRDAGKLVMYHNHNFEWERLSNGRTMMDVLLESMPADIMGITLDTYWVQAAGADVCDFMDKVSGRIPCVHLKDMAVKGFEQRMAAVGEGNLDFPKILALLKKLGKTKHLLVEQDNCYGDSPFYCLKRSYDYVKRLGY